jgi:hypothetical protein
MPKITIKECDVYKQLSFCLKKSKSDVLASGLVILRFFMQTSLSQATYLGSGFVINCLINEHILRNIKRIGLPIDIVVIKV